MEDFSLAGYEVDQLIGFGGSGEVWRARELATGHVVALKRLRGATPTSVEGDPLRREAALLGTVQHEHVVALRAVVPTDEGLVLVLDYASGGSLAALLAARGRLSAGEVVTIGAPLAQALSDVHARGVCHGDITPSNIVFDESGKPLLADLGVARLVGEGGSPTAATPGYADPTAVAGWQLPARIAGPASDVHGLAGPA
ncbi:MAG TPA: serine/threonine-protein kinase, partial [Acidothermaceae bacterium]